MTETCHREQVFLAQRNTRGAKQEERYRGHNMVLQVCVADLPCVFPDRRKYGLDKTLRETSNARWEHEWYFVILLSLRKFLYRG